MNITFFNTVLISLLKQLNVVLIYVLLGHIIHRFFTSDGIGIFWPSNGLALAAVLIGGWRYIWTVVAASVLLHFPFFREPLGSIIGITLVNTIQVSLGAWLLIRFNLCLSLRTLNDYLKLITLGGAVASFFSASLAGWVLLQTGLIQLIDYFPSVLRWWMGNVLGIVLLTPLILAWSQKIPSVIPKAWLESLLLLSVIVLTGQIIFLGWFTDYLTVPPKAFIMFLPVTVLAIRQGMRATTLALNIIAIQALSGAYLKVGYFAHEIAESQLYNYWFYVLSLSGIAISLTLYVNELKQKKQSLSISEAHLRLSQIGGGIGCWEFNLLTDRGTWSDNCADILGFHNLYQPTWTEFLAAVHPDDQQKLMDAKQMQIEQTKKYDVEYRFITENTDIRWLRSVGQVEYDAKGKPVIMRGIVQDITKRKKTEQEIESLAFYDALTGLPNRRLLLERIEKLLNSSTNTHFQNALLFIDVDNFKNLNDTLGHNIGDLLLKQVAERLLNSIRKNDTVVRLGGDEFVLMLENLSSDYAEAMQQTEKIAKKILSLFNQPFQLIHHNYYSTASIGVTLFQKQQLSIENILKEADIAMYQAKSSGRNTLCFFNPDMQVNITQRVALETDLRLAIIDNQFKLYYQLQSSHTHTILGAEVLLRWQHPQQGLITPDKFIPLAEETGLILSIGQWVLETACYQLKHWENNSQTQHLQLAVNVSAKQFHQTDFVEQVQRILTLTAIRPDKLKLELTESLVLDDIHDTIQKMNALRSIGVRFSMDDFGTGYASLSYLTQLPLDQIKIDRSFISNIGIKPTDAIIVQTIIGMAHNLDIEVIAEGVETEQQRAFLEQHGCSLYQGYLFGKPLPIELFDELLAKSNSTKN